MPGGSIGHPTSPAILFVKIQVTRPGRHHDVQFPRGTGDSDSRVARLRPAETGRGFPLERLFLPRHFDVCGIGSGGHQCVSDLDDPLLDRMRVLNYCVMP